MSAAWSQPALLKARRFWRPPRHTTKMGDGLFLDQRLAGLDVSLFSHVESETTVADQQSLLGLQHACRTTRGSYAYLEIGSHLGGSLQPFVLDPLCQSIASIDPRPPAQSDDTGRTWHYPENSTARMRSLLAAIPGADLSKLHSFDADTRGVAVQDLPARPDLCFVDGDHSTDAALQDAMFCREAMQDDGCIVFHDRDLVRNAVSVLMERLSRDGLPFTAYACPDNVFVVEVGRSQVYKALPVTGLRWRTMHATWLLGKRLQSNDRPLQGILLLDDMTGRLYDHVHVPVERSRHRIARMVKDVRRLARRNRKLRRRVRRLVRSARRPVRRSVRRVVRIGGRMRRRPSSRTGR